MAEASQTETAHGTFCWNELMTRDTSAAKTFFTQLFGWTTEEMDMGPMGIYTLFMNGDKPAAGMMEMKGPEFEGVPPNWLGYIGVDDVDEAVKKVESLGGKVCQPPMDIPHAGRFAVITDPTGATVGFFKPNEA